MAAPVARDQELELRIDSLAYGGNGVARLNGFVVFVRRALPGDTVRARVTKVKRNHAEAVSLEVVEAGAPRVDAPCAHYPACGGCRFQDLAYEAQLEAKARQVGDALARIGRLSGFELEPAVPAESIFHYRNKLEYSFAETPEGLALGFHRAGRWDEVLDVERCWLTTDLGNAIRNAVKEWARAQGLAPFDQERQEGYLRHLVVREGRNTGQALVVLVTAPGELIVAASFVEALRRFPEVRSIHWAVNDTPAEVTNLPSRLLWGEDAIEEEILGLRFRIRPNAFLQTNTAMCEILYRLAAEYAGLTGQETVYDLYCGTGTIARRAHGLGHRVLGGVRRLRGGERRAERDRQRGLLRGRRGRRPGRAPRARRTAGRRLRRPAARRALRKGTPQDRTPRGAADRLRLLQPDHAGRELQGARRRVGLPARARPAG
jgi:23S rRNA (uracil1939-C5)-methyltransferase